MSVDLYNEDCLLGMKDIPSESIDCILTDPPYLYLKHKLDRPFDGQAFFNEAKRILKKDGFIVLFGRGTSFYRWNTILADMGFQFKEEIVWDKVRNTSPLHPLMRVHETVSIHTKKGGTINRVKIPYTEMKGHDMKSIAQDVKRICSALKNPQGVERLRHFIETNTFDYDKPHTAANNTTISSGIHNPDRATSILDTVQNGMIEKTIIKDDFATVERDYNVVSRTGGSSSGFRETTTLQSVECGMNERSIVRDDRITRYKDGITVCSGIKAGCREINALQSIEMGLNEKSIIKENRDHFATIHPTQKPVRLLERLLSLVTKEGDVILDPFAGSASTAIACQNTGRGFIGYEIDNEYYQSAILRIFGNQQLDLRSVL